MKEILRFNVRILRPAEYKQLLNGCSKPDMRTMLQALLYTGMRYIEMKRFQKYTSWFDGNGFIHLPREAVLKKARTQMERFVRLNPQGKLIIEYFVQMKRPLPSYQSWSENMKCWARRGGLSETGLGSKTMRKTWESWIMFYYPKHSMDVALSQGHNTVTSLRHYLNMPFTDMDRVEMKEFVEGWI